MRLHSTPFQSNEEHILKVFFIVVASVWTYGIVVATDTLSQGDNLNSSDHLVSRNGIVILRFFKQTYGMKWKNKDAGYYLSMFFKEDSLDHPIWSANRNDPITDDSGVLIVDNSGMKITQSRGANPIRIFSLPSTSQITNNIKLVLHDSGNLVLQHETSQGENITLWQSFDFPNDSFLPGMRLGFIRGRNSWLTSWLTESIPATGAFTLGWDPDSRRLIVRLRDRVMWTSGESFGNIPSLDTLNMNYNFTTVSDVDRQQYIYYSLVTDKYTPEERRKNARLVLTNDGSLIMGDRMYAFSSKLCDSSTTKYGCRRWEGPKCRNKNDRYEIRSIRVTDKNSQNSSLMGNTSLSISDCKDICWNDCKCMGVGENMDLGCALLSGPFEDGVLDGSNYQVIIRRRHSSKRWIWILVSVASGLTAVICIGFFFLWWRRRRTN